MKISHKLFIGFAVIVTPITLFSVFTTISIQKELKKVGDFRNYSLYFTQNNAMKATRAVEESFAYIASNEKSEKESFLAWAEKLDLVAEKARKLEDKEVTNDEEEKEIFETITSGQADLVKKAKEVFNEHETRNFVTNKLFHEYEDIIDELLFNYEKLIDIQKKR